MAQPRQKSSKSLKNKRRANWKLKPLHLAVCPQCKHPKMSHRVCPNCGHYAGRTAVTVE
ncbi:MAG: 50S ribosomal protein L32 [Sulfobacillus sp.]|jgi:large subunit ribosomal protein L32